MKTSNRILVITGIVIVAAIIASILYTKNMLGDPSEYKTYRIESNAGIVNTIDASDFTGISAEGYWDISVVQGEEYHVEIATNSKVADNEVIIEKKGDILFLKTRKNRFLSSPKLKVQMPSIGKTDLKGVGSFHMSGFEINELIISTDGVISITGADSRIQDMSFRGDGLLKMDMNDSPVVSADIRYNGLYLIDLFMDGGQLTGKIDGMGRFTHRGDVQENSLKVNSARHVIKVE